MTSPATFSKKANAKRAAQKAFGSDAIETVDYHCFAVEGGRWCYAAGPLRPSPAAPAPGETAPEIEAAPEVEANNPPDAPARKPRGRRAEIEAAAARGILPEPPDFSAATHKPYRKKLADLVALVEARDAAGLRAYPINPYSSSPKALDRYRHLCVQAFDAQSADPQSSGASPDIATFEANAIRDADHFVATRFRGRGQYDQRRAETLVDAKAAAEELGGRATIHAVQPNGRSIDVSGH